MRSLLIFALLSFGFLASTQAQEAQVFTKNGKILDVIKTPNNTLVELSKADSTFNFNVAVANFPSGKKLDWHAHPGGQILIITEGVGYYQEKGKAKIVVRKGEIITCQPGIVHWHGSSVENGVTYLAISPAQKGPTVWLDKVTEEDYLKK
jgi:quercetin dioxygenase-like cupin family protein